MAFKGEEVYIDPSLQAKLSNPVIARSTDLIGTTKQSLNTFEYLRRELVSRKYSYKTVKGYIYYNRDFLQFTGKSPSEIYDNDMKDYLLYLAEEKQAATSTLNRVINALKFYYGILLRKKFLYEMKRPRKDKSCLLFYVRKESQKYYPQVTTLSIKPF